MYPHHIACVKLIDQIGNGGDTCGGCGLNSWTEEYRENSRKSCPVHSQESWANMNPPSPKIPSKSFLCAYCKLSVPHK